jgi:hypothetical protein
VQVTVGDGVIEVHAEGGGSIRVASHGADVAVFSEAGVDQSEGHRGAPVEETGGGDEVYIELTETCVLVFARKRFDREGCGDGEVGVERCQVIGLQVIDADLVGDGLLRDAQQAAEARLAIFTLADNDCVKELAGAVGGIESEVFKSGVCSRELYRSERSRRRLDRGKHGGGSRGVTGAWGEHISTARTRLIMVVIIVKGLG